MFIKGNTLNNLKIKAVVVESENFEIYKTIRDDSLLVVKESLYNEWVKEKLFFSVDPFKKIVIDEEIFFYVKSKKEHLLVTVENGGVLFDRQQALNFVFVLKQMRKITKASMYDGLYLEEFGYMLPT